MIKFNEAQANKAYSVLLDLLIATDVVPNSRDGLYCNRYSSILNASKIRYIKPYLTTIKNAIIRRTFNFSEIDSAFRTLYNQRVTFGDTPKADERNVWKPNRDTTLPKFIAYVCAKKNIFWDDTAYSKEEMDTIKADSLFARMLYEAECFVTQPLPKARRTTLVDPSTGSSGGSTSGAPKSGYKSSGPQSANVVGLVGAPGEKTTVSGKVYTVIGDKKGAIVPNAFIHPVNNPDVGEKASVNSDGLPIVKFGAGNGYTDLTVYSEDESVMNTIKANLEAKGALDKYGKVAYIVSVKPNAGGYFKVNTEYGELLVKPTKLNEKLFEEIIEAMKATEADVKPEEENIDLDEDIPIIPNIKEFAALATLYD